MAKKAVKKAAKKVASRPPTRRTARPATAAPAAPAEATTAATTEVTAQADGPVFVVYQKQAGSYNVPGYRFNSFEAKACDPGVAAKLPAEYCKVHKTEEAAAKDAKALRDAAMGRKK